MKIHLIACGGAVMHNMAIALHKKGYQVSGSDDEIFEPAKSRLQEHGLLPASWGWDIAKITSDLDLVILGMHARGDNPELLKAIEMKIKVYSFPEYLYEQTKNKKRIVVGGSHGKTSVCSIIMHVMKKCGMHFDYMVGAKLEGFDTMVNLEEQNSIAVFEGDEYLSSAIDPRPKFHWYKPHIAVITGIAWDHINVFPTFGEYVQQFETYINLIEKDGVLIYYSDDENLEMLAKNANSITSIPYQELESQRLGSHSLVSLDGDTFPVSLIGRHNMQNINAARMVCNQIGISNQDFFNALADFKGAAKRLQLVAATDNASFYIDFAHAPSKLKATTEAVKSQFPERELIACIELHTFSSLSKSFLPQYRNSMDMADEAIVYYNKHVIEHKKLENIEPDMVKNAFGRNIKVFNDSGMLRDYLVQKLWKNKNLLMMSSGNFDGIDFDMLATEIGMK